MKLPLLLITLLLASSPAFANKAYTAGSFDGENYVLTFYLVDNTDSLYSVSVVEPRSVRRDGYAVPSVFSFDCRKGEGSGYVAMGDNRSEAFAQEVLTYYLLEFCTRIGYRYEDQVKQ